MERIVVIVRCSDDTYGQKYSIDRMQRAFAHFHPQFDFRLFTAAQEQEYYKQWPWLTPYLMHPVSCLPYLDSYDLFVHIDADSVLVGNIEDILNVDYDVFGVKNNHYGSGAGKYEPITIPGITIEQYCNAGFWATRNKQFLIDYLEKCRVIGEKQLQGDDNTAFNALVYGSAYKFKMLDTPYVSYGLTNAWGASPLWGHTHWDSWKEIYVQDNKLWLINQLGNKMEIKILHMAGGSIREECMKYQPMYEWLYSWVQPEVAEYIRRIVC